MKKILFSDVDGTLFRSGKSLSIKNDEALRYFQKAGHKIAICTGRNYFEMQSVLRKTHFVYDYLVLNNGALIMDHEGRVLYEKKISFSTGKAIIERIRQESHMWSWFCDGHKNLGRNDTICKEVSLERDHQDVDISCFESYLQSDHFQIICLNQENQQIDRTKEVAAWVEAHFSDEVTCFFNEYFVDIVPSGCSKGSGIDRLLSLLPETFDQILAIGDSYNDESMIERADIGATFTYAPQEIQEKADVVVDYVYELLEKTMQVS